MDWDRINVWTNTFYAVLHALRLARDNQFGDLNTLHDTSLSAKNWISPECSYNSALIEHQHGGNTIIFRRDPNNHFENISKQVVKMLIQDLTVIFDQMMAESMSEHGFKEQNYPQSKIEKLATQLDCEKFKWALNGCLELVAVRNVLTHSDGRWNKKSIKIVEEFMCPSPKVGDVLVVGVPMLFLYRKAIRTFLNQTKL